MKAESLAESQKAVGGSGGGVKPKDRRATVSFGGSELLGSAPSLSAFVTNAPSIDIVDTKEVQDVASIVVFNVNEASFEHTDIPEEGKRPASRRASIL